MARVIDIKCPTCSAPLQITPGAQQVTCKYCGGTSVIDRGAARPAGGGTVVQAPKPNTAPLVLAGALAGLATIGAGVALAVNTASVDLPAIAPPGAPATAAKGSAAAVPDKLRFGDQPMLADVDGDGTIDVVGKVDQTGDPYTIAAFNGRDGAILWQTEPLTKDAQDGSAKRAIVHGRLLSIDGLGKVQAYELRTGTPAWSTLLGEKAQRVCAGESLIVVETADEVRHGLDPPSGKKQTLDKKTPCTPVFSSDEEETPGYTMIGWWDFDKHRLDKNEVDGLSAHRALIPADPEAPRFVLGSRDKGTSVAMVGAVAKRDVLWKDVVPGVDPLTTTVNVTTQQAAYADGRLVIPYNMKDSGGGVRMACFDARTGTRLWDVQVHKGSQVSSGIAVTADDVFYATWTELHVLSLKTGELRFRLGKSF
ncbi:zinc finger domain-containing protein [Nannocystis pusilla]|uniref:PQQ-like beta-propeller repeat protein n=1 Tax=Nannocystis pusilla TaxID=889268 RepID=A0ABS7TK01_9BACT|nr:PQQ-binding-like beta-propeller repeat protein [Nannocystis pusilla]MBZ5708536.1 PQQ-like beta-propeller repeat protein [Nannocystis pusilla]